jgi:hypothetical protein
VWSLWEVTLPGLARKNVWPVLEAWLPLPTYGDLGLLFTRASLSMASLETMMECSSLYLAFIFVPSFVFCHFQTGLSQQLDLVALSQEEQSG